MIAIIFAAGIGSRLKPFTVFHPKALAPLGNKPALVRVAEKMADAGARRIIVNVHHFPQQIIDCLSALPFADIIEISDESALLLDTGGALVKIAGESHSFASASDHEPFVVHNADIYTDFPIKDMMYAFETSGSDATILVDPERHSTRHFLFDSHGNLCGWENTAKGLLKPADLKDASGLTAAAFGGVHVLSKRTIEALGNSSPAVLSPFSITDWYIDNCNRIVIKAFTPAENYNWHDIGTPEKLEAAQACFGRMVINLCLGVKIT